MDPSGGIAILLDGEFVKKVLQKRLKRFPTAQDITGICHDLMQKPDLVNSKLHRIYYYTADPLTVGRAINPVDKSTVNFNDSPVAVKNAALLESLELAPNVAVRRGVLALQGWKLGNQAMRSVKRGGKDHFSATDFVPNIQQKGVDMCIGLDMAALALKRLVYGVLLVTGDADMLPAMKFVRREGLRVYLHTMDHQSIRRDLRAHADIIV